MANRTIARLFDSYADAAAAVRDLEAAGFKSDDISLVARGADGEPTVADPEDESRTGMTGAATGAGTGATIGTLVGGGAGLLAGLGALAIPGVGPIVAAGWLVAALTGAGVGAAAGGLLGGLTQAGIGEEQAEVYAEGVRRGGNLVTVRADETRSAEAESIMQRHNAQDHDVNTGRWSETGWTRHDTTTTTQPATMGLGTAGGLGAAGALGAGTGMGAMPGGTTMGGASIGTRTDAAIARTSDGTPGNPPGTMASRGVDDMAGTNISGARPEHDRSSGDSAPDGTPGNPPGTKATRAIDDAAGTNISGARPENEVNPNRNPKPAR